MVDVENHKEFYRLISQASKDWRNTPQGKLVNNGYVDKLRQERIFRYRLIHTDRELLEDYCLLFIVKKEDLDRTIYTLKKNNLFYCHTTINNQEIIGMFFKNPLDNYDKGRILRLLSSNIDVEFERDYGSLWTISEEYFDNVTNYLDFFIFKNYFETEEFKNRNSIQGILSIPVNQLLIKERENGSKGYKITTSKWRICL